MKGTKTISIFWHMPLLSLDCLGYPVSLFVFWSSWTFLQTISSAHVSTFSSLWVSASAPFFPIRFNFYSFAQELLSPLRCCTHFHRPPTSSPSFSSPFEVPLSLIGLLRWSMFFDGRIQYRHHRSLIHNCFIHPRQLLWLLFIELPAWHDLLDMGYVE